MSPLPQFFERAGMFRARESAWEADCGMHHASFYIACPANERRLFPVRDYGNRDLSQIANYGSLRPRSMPRSALVVRPVLRRFLFTYVPSCYLPGISTAGVATGVRFLARPACFSPLKPLYGLILTSF